MKKRWMLILLLAAVLPMPAQTPRQGKGTEAYQWAYATDASAPAAAPSNAGQADRTPKRVAGSTLTFTLQQVHDHFNPADWHPGDVPAPPEIVTHGKKPNVTACALCHYPNGLGRPQNAALAGLSVDYFTQQMMDFKSGYRASADARKANTKQMIAFAKGMSDAEIRATATYFSTLPYKNWVKVVESDTAPKTRIARGMFVKLAGNETEPLGNRILEVPENAEATRLHDDHAGFIAYVPVGSIKKGEALATGKGGDKSIACVHCHGVDFSGLGDTPPLAGRSPSYMTRQIHDFQTGARNGLGMLTTTMAMAVDKMTPEEVLAVCAYIASLPPPAPAP